MNKRRHQGNRVAVMVLMAAGLVVASCGHRGESDLKACAESFSTAYFNWQFERALPYCTPESAKWLSYMASQVNSSDVEALRSMAEGATCEMGEVAYSDSDSTATVEVTVRNSLTMDTLGQAARLLPQARYAVPMTMRHGKWRVNLSGPLRAEKD